MITSIFGRDYPAEIVKDESGRKLKISIPLSQAEIEAQDYMNMTGVMIGVGSLYVPRIDPAVDQGLEVQFKRGNQEFLSVSAATETLKEVLDTTIEDRSWAPGWISRWRKGRSIKSLFKI